VPRLYMRDRTYWCWGYDIDGKRWRESTHQVEKRAAELAAREIERRFAADPAARARSKLTIEKALKHVLTYQREAGRAPATIRAATYHAQHLVAHLNPAAPLASVKLADTTNYLRARLAEGADRHTVAKELGMLAQAIRRCAKLGIYVPAVDPSHLIPDELGKVYTPRERWLAVDEYHRLHAELRRTSAHPCSSTDRSEYLLMYCHEGLRKSELFAVEPEDYDPLRHELRVRGTKTEEADRLVSLTEAAEMVLARRIDAAGGGKPFPVWHTVVRDLGRACDRIGIARVTPNDLRRTFCSWLCNEGVPERVAAELMGHADTTMVRAVYGHLDRASMATAVKALESAVTRGVTANAKYPAHVTPLRSAAFAKILEKSRETAALPG
jgi:integrase